MAIRRPPRALGPAGRKFWSKVTAEVVLESEHDLERLLQTCKCLDEIAEAEEVIAREGRYIKDRFQQIREHPAMKTIRDSRILFLRGVRELQLDATDPEESRPPRLY